MNCISHMIVLTPSYQYLELQSDQCSINTLNVSGIIRQNFTSKLPWAMTIISAKHKNSYHCIITTREIGCRNLRDRV